MKKEEKINYNQMSYEEILLKHKPQFCIGISFVPYGYQLDIFKDGKTCHSIAHDFGGSYKVKKLVLEFEKKFNTMMEEFVKNK